MIRAIGIVCKPIKEMVSTVVPPLIMRPAEIDVVRQRHWFRETRQVFDYLNEHGHGLDTLSMGTSADFEAAILEGATIVRIGTAIFGPRDAKTAGETPN